MKQQDNREDDRPTELLPDLPVTANQAAETKGGSSTIPPINGHYQAMLDQANLSLLERR